jgi:hypothetical protein
VARSRETFFIGHYQSMKTLSLRAHRGGLKIQPRYRLVLMPRSRRQKTFRARHRCPTSTAICGGWNRHPLTGPNQRSSRGNKVCLLGTPARLRRGGRQCPTTTRIAVTLMVARSANPVTVPPMPSPRCSGNHHTRLSDNVRLGRVLVFSVDAAAISRMWRAGTSVFLLA